MRDVMSYRGPDATGLTSGPGYALGHRRLAIIDLSERGTQPMANEDGSVETVFNGAIYNFAELKNELVKKGHRFKSETDTEVLVHGYEQWGLHELLQRIRGMYAFAILDQNLRQLHLARDPLGKKPLYFKHTKKEVVFASSARALAFGVDPAPEIDTVAVCHLLWDLYIPGPRSIFVGVEKVSPGSAVSIGPEGCRREVTHWHADFLNPELRLDDGEWLEESERVLETAVKRRLVADVPVGVLLSGGIDSSLVTVMAARHTKKVQTFSVATEHPDLDETRFAQAVADRYGTDHHVLAVRSNIREDLGRLVAAMGEPLGDASAANVFAIAQQAREYVTVVLTGDGGDEAFGGYTHYLAYFIADQLRRIVPTMLNHRLVQLGDLLRANGPGVMHRLGTVMGLAGEPFRQGLFAKSMAMNTETLDQLCTPEFKERLGAEAINAHYLRALPKSTSRETVNDVMQVRLKTILADDYLPKVDGSTMAASLEARSPFLDVDVMNVAMRIPANCRFRGGHAKSVLRRLALKHVPSQCVRRRKQGFVAPVGSWLRNDWPDLVDEVILGPQIERRGWFRRETLCRVVNEHRNGADHGYLLWSLLVLELWIRMTVERSLSAADVI
jgi:asparagine synthase (glutamine-hydrolysing)